MAATKLPAAHEQTGSAGLDRIQRFVQQLARSIGKPFTGGVVLKRVVITNTATNVTHGLGRAWQGWILIRNSSSAFVFESPAQPSDPTKQIGLQASAANVTVDLYVF